MDIELIFLIYKSTDYLDLILKQKDFYCADGANVKVRIVGNDPTPEVVDGLERSGLPYNVYNDPKPNDYYLNRVYRCWNYAGFSSESENICFLNSDMVFSYGWLDALLAHHDGINIPCSRLVESGKMPSGTYGVSYNCGKTPKTIDFEKWESVAEHYRIGQIRMGGLFMPCVFQKSRFLESGGYPEGNIYLDGIGTTNGRVTQSGDDWYFRKLEHEYGMKHITVFDSLVYHIQEGEKDEYQKDF